MGRFRKKPVEIEAFQMTEERWLGNSEWPNWLNEAWQRERGEEGSLFSGEEGSLFSDAADPARQRLCIGTLEGVHRVAWDDWIIRGVKGELYPCKPDIFEATYDPIAEEADG
ncbi:MAG: hypothetical protein ACR2P5_05995 [Gammaproteobacteria bacterium]